MPKSETPKVKAKRAARATKKTTSSHFPSKPYMRALRAQSPTSVPTAAWSTTDDELLLRTKASGKKWVEISPMFQGKTSNACRKRHARLVTHAQIEWDEFKERDLAVEFVNAKVGFFKMIAGNLKLEWRQVEKKCLELGFKTLLEKGKRIPIPFPPLEFQPAPVGDAIPEGTTRPTTYSPQLKSGKPLLSPSKPFKFKVIPDLELSDSGDGDDDDDDDDISQARPLRFQNQSMMVKEELAMHQREGEDRNVSQGGRDDLGADNGLVLRVPAKAIDGPGL